MHFSVATRPRHLDVSRRLEVHGIHLLLVVQGLHGSVGLRVVGITNEAEAPAAAGVAILDDDLDGCERTIGGGSSVLSNRVALTASST